MTGETENERLPFATKVRHAVREPRAFLVWARAKTASKMQDWLGLPMAFNRLDFNASYREHVAHLKLRSKDVSTALKMAVGGQFEAFGQMQRDLLVSVGLTPESYVIDVGCGSGRLAAPLSSYLERGRYFGIDVVPELVAHAAAVAARPEWRFETANGLSINEKDGQADFVCFFSVLTHLLHEESFVYLREAARVLRPGGKIVLSFLDFAVPNHWQVFERNVAHVGTRIHLNQFISKDCLGAWASHLGLSIDATFNGDTPHIPLAAPVVLDDGTRVESTGSLGQSVCVLVKRAAGR